MGSGLADGATLADAEGDPDGEGVAEGAWATGEELGGGLVVPQAASRITTESEAAIRRTMRLVASSGGSSEAW